MCAVWQKMCIFGFFVQLSARIECSAKIEMKAKKKCELKNSYQKKRFEPSTENARKAQKMHKHSHTHTHMYIVYNHLRGDIVVIK